MGDHNTAFGQSQPDVSQAAAEHVMEPVIRLRGAGRRRHPEPIHLADPPLPYATRATPLNNLPLRFVTEMLPALPGPLPNGALYPTTSQLAGTARRSGTEADGATDERTIEEPAPVVDWLLAAPWFAVWPLIPLTPRPLLTTAVGGATGTTLAATGAQNFAA